MHGANDYIVVVSINRLLRREALYNPVWRRYCNVTLCNVPHVNEGYKYYEGDVVMLCNVPHVNVDYKYLLLFTYDMIMREML